MSGTWIVVAHRAGARIFETHGRGSGLDYVQELRNEAGRLKDSELDSDRQGAAGHSSHHGQDSLSREQSPHERAAADFARELSRLLERGRNEHAYDDVVLVAEPGFLGMLREALDAPTASLVRAEIPKNLSKMDMQALTPYLAETVAL
ncbi:MAG TPA: host attachment protein [Polyangiales bacterium]|nr:host attachment protein [Polyangiales bacterium]